jgi:CBS domain-containing protein
MQLSELADLIAQRDPEIARRQGTPIVDEQNRLVGIITRGDVVRALEAGPNGTTVLDAGSRDLIVAYPDEVLHDAVTKMVRNNVGRLPVVDRNDERHLIGYLGRASVMTARLRRVEEEHFRETGLLAGA